MPFCFTKKVIIHFPFSEQLHSSILMYLFNLYLHLKGTRVQIYEEY